MTRACGDGESVQPRRESAVTRHITEMSLPGSSHVFTALVKKLMRFLRIVLVRYGRTFCGVIHMHCVYWKRSTAALGVQCPVGMGTLDDRIINTVFMIFGQIVT